ncbi:MAG: FAD-dependent oxidoreductase, partial [Atribacterota bacterium]|nr:FAD-dependent oxidoreductase [Atribacterota bacterium]
YNIEVYLNTMVIDITADKQITAVNSDKGLLKIKAGAIILAMGCRERPRGAINIPGSRPAGILTAGTAQRFINVEGYFPGKNIVILGSGDIGMIMARRVILENARVEAVVEIMPYIGGLIRNEYQCLKDYGIPVYLRHTVTEIHGNERIEGVTISKLDEKFKIVEGTEKYIDCDTLLLSVGLIPENELSKSAGVMLSSVTGGPIIDENMHTNIPGIFAAGNVVHVHDLVDYVTLGGERAGKSVAAYLSGKLGDGNHRIKLEKGSNIRYIVPEYISGVSDVSLYLRVMDPAEKVTLKIGRDLFTKDMKMVKPSEMIKIDLPSKIIKNIMDGRLRIDCVIHKTGNVDQIENGHNEKEIVCLVCPLACRGKVYVDENGEITRTINFKCKRGKEFAVRELKDPERILTGTVKTVDSLQPLLPFRSSKPISMNLIKKSMEELAEIEIDHPLKIGDLIVKNILGSGTDIIATMDYPFKRDREVNKYGKQ